MFAFVHRILAIVKKNSTSWKRSFRARLSLDRLEGRAIPSATPAANPSGGTTGIIKALPTPPSRETDGGGGLGDHAGHSTGHTWSNMYVRGLEDLEETSPGEPGQNVGETIDWFMNQDWEISQGSYDQALPQAYGEFVQINVDSPTQPFAGQQEAKLFAVVTGRTQADMDLFARTTGRK